MLNDKYKLNYCKEMGAEPGRRFLTQPAEKQEPVIVVFTSSYGSGRFTAYESWTQAMQEDSEFW